MFIISKKDADPHEEYNTFNLLSIWYLIKDPQQSLVDIIIIINFTS